MIAFIEWLLGNDWIVLCFSRWSTCPTWHLRQHLSQSGLERLRRHPPLITIILCGQRLRLISRRLHFLNRLASGLDYTQMALFTHHLDLTLEPIMKVYCLLAFRHVQCVTLLQRLLLSYQILSACRTAISPTFLLLLWCLHELWSVADGSGRGSVACRSLLNLMLGVGVFCPASLNGRRGLLLGLMQTIEDGLVRCIIWGDAGRCLLHLLFRTILYYCLFSILFNPKYIIIYKYITK